MNTRLKKGLMSKVIYIKKNIQCDLFWAWLQLLPLVSPRNENLNLLVRIKFLNLFLYTRDETGRIMWLGMAGWHPHRFLHNNFSSVYRIFTKLGHMIPLWKGKNSIYFGVIRSKIKVTITINRIFDNGRFCTITLVLYIGSLTNLATWFPCGRGRTLFILGSLPLFRLIISIYGHILWYTHFYFFCFFVLFKIEN